MFLFYKLVLAHLVADFILQFEELYQLKLKSKLGQVFHALIHGVVSLILFIPYLPVSLFPWIFIAVIVTIHYFQDLLKYRLRDIYPKDNFYFFTLDQIVHILFLATLLLFPFSKAAPAFTRFPGAQFYWSDGWTLGPIIFLLSTFGGSYFLHAFRLSFFESTRPDHFITNFEILHGIVERSLITGIFLFYPNCVIAYPLVGLLRLPFKKLRSLTDFLLSFLYGAAVGIFFRLW